jgi:hypothetical protein
MALYVIVFLFSLYKYPLYKNTPLRFLPIILFLTAITEFMGYFINEGYFIGMKYPETNYVIYNLYYLIHFSFFYYVFMKMINNRRFKTYIKIGVGIFWLFFLEEVVFTGISIDSFAKAYIAGAGILVLCIILYFISILQSSLVLVVKTDLLFWVSVGLFLFYVGYIPIKIIKTWFYKPDSFFEILLVIQFSLIIVMYLCFMLGLLWMKKRS